MSKEKKKINTKRVNVDEIESIAMILDENVNLRKRVLNKIRTLRSQATMTSTGIAPQKSEENQNTKSK